MKNIYLLLLIFAAMNLNANAQDKTIWITGFVFANEQGGITGVPYASIYLYDVDDETRPAYVCFTSKNGAYDLGKIKLKNYVIRIYAPGHEMRVKRVANLPADFEHNFTLNLQMKRTDESLIYSKVFPTGKTHMPVSLFDAIDQIEDLEFDRENCELTKDDKVVKITLGGYFIDRDILFDLDKRVPVKEIKSMIYYDLSNVENSLYEGVLELEINHSDVMPPLDFVPFETMDYDF